MNKWLYAIVSIIVVAYFILSGLFIMKKAKDETDSDIKKKLMAVGGINLGIGVVIGLIVVFVLYKLITGYEDYSYMFTIEK